MVKVRILTAVALVVVLLLAIFEAPSVVWQAFVAFLVCLAGREWFALMGLPAKTCVGLGVLAAVPALCFGQFCSDFFWHSFSVFVYVIAVLFWLVVVPPVLRARPMFHGPFWRYGAGFVVLIPASIAMIQLRQVHPWVLIAALAPVWIADIFAFFVGRTIGKHKLAPNISPGKSWEGVAGAVVGVVIYALVVQQFIPAIASVLGVIICVAVAFFFTAMSVMGDLFESLAKRQAGVKDSGNLLPGHGGVLDRVDSLLSTLPFAGVLLSAWHIWI
jgi:phosphatidate cytidylyltransferase